MRRFCVTMLAWLAMLGAPTAGRADDKLVISRDQLRVRAIKNGERFDAIFDVRQGDGRWREVLSTAAKATAAPWDARVTPVSAWVNGRGVYWASRSPIPGGISFENFEMVAPFQQGQEFWFGVEPMPAPDDTKANTR